MIERSDIVLCQSRVWSGLLTACNISPRNRQQLSHLKTMFHHVYLLATSLGHTEVSSCFVSVPLVIRFTCLLQHVVIQRLAFS